MEAISPSCVPELGGECNLVSQCGCHSWCMYPGGCRLAWFGSGTQCYAREHCSGREGGRHVGQTCEDDGDCAGGGFCFSPYEAILEKRCHRWCYTNDDCGWPASTCDQIVLLWTEPGTPCFPGIDLRPYMACSIPGYSL